MHRLAVLIAAGVLCGMSPADAAARPKHKIRAVAHGAPVAQPVGANRPIWAAPQQCFTNDGNGRFLPCDIGDGR
jgi:hypothetical protein